MATTKKKTATKNKNKGKDITPKDKITTKLPYSYYNEKAPKRKKNDGEAVI